MSAAKRLERIAPPGECDWCGVPTGGEAIGMCEDCERAMRTPLPSPEPVVVVPATEWAAMLKRVARLEQRVRDLMAGDP